MSHIFALLEKLYSLTKNKFAHNVKKQVIKQINVLKIKTRKVVQYNYQNPLLSIS